MENRKLYVTATDTFMSGWGGASGKKSKVVVVCDDWEQVDRVRSNMESKSKEMKYINVYREKPHFSPSRFHTMFYKASECSLWN